MRDTGSARGESGPKRRLSRRVRMGLWLLVVGWLVAGAALFGSWSGLLGPDRSGPPEPGAGPDVALVAVRVDPEPPVLALLYRGSDSRMIVLLPAGTLVEVPGLGAPLSLGATLVTEGSDALAVAVANMLGIRVPPVIEGSAAQLEGLVEDLGGLDVDVPETIELVTDGVLHTLYARGRSHLSAAELVRFVSMSLPESNELERVTRQHAVWRGLVQAAEDTDALTTIATHLASWQTPATRAGIQRVLGAMARDGVGISTLPVERAGVAQEDLYAPHRDVADRLREALHEVATVESREGRRVRLLIGTQAPVGPAVARTLVDAGFVIVLTGRAAEPYDQTRVVMADSTPQMRQTAREITELLGTGRPGLYTTPQTVFDVTLVVGEDWARMQGIEEPRSP